MNYPEIVVVCATCGEDLESYWDRLVSGRLELAVKPCAHCAIEATHIPCPLLRGEDDQRSLHEAVESFRKASE